MNAAEYLVTLRDRMSGPATAAEGALAKLEGQIKSGTGSLAGLESKLESAQAKLTAMGKGGGKGSMSEQFDALNKQKKVVADLQAQIGEKKQGLGILKGGLGEFKKLAEDSKSTALSMDKIGEAAQGAGGPVGGIASKLKSIAEGGKAGLIMAIANAVLYLATAAVVAAVALTTFALAMADAARSSRLLSGAAAGSAAGGVELEAVITDIANKSPLARDKIAELGRSMELANLRGRNMQNALEAVATASAAVGDSAGGAFKSIAEKSQFARRFLLTKADLAGTGVAFADVAASLAKSMGISVASATTLIQQGGVSVAKGLEAMNAAVQAKFGKTVAAQMISLSVQFDKMKTNIGRLFDGIDIEPFLRGLSKITSLFAENTVTGRALKALLEKVFTPLFAASESLFPVISAFMRGMVIGALAVAIAFLWVKKQLVEAFGGDSASKIDWIKTAMYAGIIATGLLVLGLVSLIGIMGLVAAVCGSLLLIVSLPFIIPLAFIGLLIYGIYRLVTAIQSIKAPDMKGLGADTIAGLVTGLLSGNGLISMAMTKLGATAMNSFKSMLGIASPSKVFAMYGKHTVEGYVQGVDDNAGAATASVEAMGSGQPGAPEVGDKASGGNVYHIAIDARGADEGMIARIEAAVRSILENEANALPEFATT
jgi:hypothetical protein